MGFSPLELTDRCAAWIEGVVGTCTFGQPLRGATTATVVPVSTPTADYVLKWFTWAAFVAEDSHRATHEALGLELARSLQVPAPDPVALDPHGDSTGHPAVLMTAVPGASLPRPDDWAVRAAVAAARLHTGEADVPYVHRPFVPDPVVPVWAGDRRLWQEALSVVGPLTDADEGIVHRDLHRWNMHWHDGALTGFVDWLSVCRGPIGEDVARVWINEVIEGDPSAGSDFRSAYRAVSNLTWDLRWEVQSVIDMLPAYRSEAAVHAWGTPVGRAKLEDCLRIALAQL